jgi:hypothetical protein
MSEDKFDGRIEGVVVRLFNFSGGTGVDVEYKTNPKLNYPEKVTVWDKGTPPVKQGDRVQVTGEISVMAEVYNEKARAKVSVNKPVWNVLSHSGDTPF